MGRAGAVPGRAGGTTPGRTPGISDGRSDGDEPEPGGAAAGACRAPGIPKVLGRGAGAGGAGAAGTAGIDETDWRGISPDLSRATSVRGLAAKSSSSATGIDGPVRRPGAANGAGVGRGAGAAGAAAAGATEAVVVLGPLPIASRTFSMRMALSQGLVR
jgi:hypothetical protein